MLSLLLSKLIESIFTPCLLWWMLPLLLSNLIESIFTPCQIEVDAPIYYYQI